MRKSMMLGVVGVMGLVAPNLHAAETSCAPMLGVLNASAGACPADFSSPLGLCTTGQMFGVVSGTTRFRATSAALSAGMPDAEAASSMSYAGELEVTTRFGVLKFSDVGLSDTANGIWTELARLRAGTGAYASSTGHLRIQGTIGSEGAFHGEVRGQLCWTR
jgi:hypothetical protein